MNRLVLALVPMTAAVLVGRAYVHAGEARAPDEARPPSRAAEPMLTMEHARARAARVSAVAYDLELELDGEAEEYAGRVDIRFELSDAGDDLTVDFVGGTTGLVRINDRVVEPLYNGNFLTLPAGSLGTGTNRVEIGFSHPYSTDGSGLYRFRDPLDGRCYLFTDFEPYDQNRLFPSFDQPDLKATFAARVTVPSTWQVISVVAESDVTDLGDRNRWTFPPSARISTYIYALHAGEYRQWTSRAGDIPLRLFARESLAEYVHPEHWFVPTRQGFEFFQGWFGIPYPFGKYDQVVVPHFNPGAMENVGAVTFNERFLRRGTVTRQARRSLASVILHEMAHMWFGNLVTMDWWNGLWLNETFATFMATLAMVEATEFTEDRLSAFRRTVGAYRADERDTTHPIEMPTPDTDAAFANFDAITYSKGSAAVTQLSHLVGQEAFRRGVGDYLEAHARGNTTIEDFLGAIGDAAGRDLGGWAREWLHEPGTNGVAVEFACADGAISELAILQTASEAWPTLRTHRTQVGVYRFDGDRVDARLVPATYSGARTEVETALGEPCPDFAYANHGDWDYARTDLDRDALRVLDGRLDAFDDTLTRAMLWQGVYEMVLYGRLTPGEFIDFALSNVHAEMSDDLARQVLDAVQSAWWYLQRLSGDAALLEETGAKVERYLWQAFADAPPGGDRQLLVFDGYVDAVTTVAGRDRIAALLQGEELPDGFDFDQDRRWNVVVKLVGWDHPRASTLLAAEQERDPSDLGRRQALAAQAARPDPEQQGRIVELLLDPEADLTVADARAYAQGLFPEHQHALQLEIVGGVLNRLQAVSDALDPGRMRAATRGLLGPICDAGYLEELSRAIGRAGTLHPSLRKSLLDARFEVRRCLAIGDVLNRSR